MIKRRPRHVKRLDTDPELSGMTSQPSRAGGSKQNLQTIGSSDCWCGLPSWHDWPGKQDKAPHPRSKGGAS